MPEFGSMDDYRADRDKLRAAYAEGFRLGAWAADGDLDADGRPTVAARDELALAFQAPDVAAAVGEWAEEYAPQEWANVNDACKDSFLDGIARGYVHANAAT